MLGGSVRTSLETSDLEGVDSLVGLGSRLCPSPGGPLSMTELPWVAEGIGQLCFPARPEVIARSLQRSAVSLSLKLTGDPGPPPPQQRCVGWYDDKGFVRDTRHRVQGLTALLSKCLSHQQASFHTHAHLHITSHWLSKNTTCWDPRDAEPTVKYVCTVRSPRATEDRCAEHIHARSYPGETVTHTYRKQAQRHQ